MQVQRSDCSDKQWSTRGICIGGGSQRLSVRLQFQLQTFLQCVLLGAVSFPILDRQVSVIRQLLQVVDLQLARGQILSKWYGFAASLKLVVPNTFHDRISGDRGRIVVEGSHGGLLHLHFDASVRCLGYRSVGAIVSGVAALREALGDGIAYVFNASRLF